MAKGEVYKGLGGEGDFMVVEGNLESGGGGELVAKGEV